MNPYVIPPLNAVLCGLSLILLLLGFGAIRRGDRRAHPPLMISAFVCSLLYLGLYLWYHARMGMTPFEGEGWIRPVVFFLLISHSLLLAAVPAFVAYLLMMALARRFDTHRAVGRWAFPLWIYVNLTGILLYNLLYYIYPA